MNTPPETSTVRDIRQQPFYWIDRDILTVHGESLGPHAIAVYNALAYRANQAGTAWPGMSDISRLTGIKSRNTIKRALAILKDHKLISIQARYSDSQQLSNEYTLLPMPPRSGEAPGQEMTHPRSLDDLPPGQEMTHPRSLDDLPPGQEMTYPGQEMTHPRSLDDHEQQSFNNNHEQQSINKKQQQQANGALPAAAASVLKMFSLDAQRFNGNGVDVAAWILYATTQPSLTNPAGYAIAQIKKGEKPASTFCEIVHFDTPLDELVRCARLERLERDGVQTGVNIPQTLYEASDEALQLLEELSEAAS